MNLFRKKEEVFINPGKKKKGKRLPEIPDTQGLSKHFGEQAQEDDEIYILPLPDEEPENKPVAAKKQKKRVKPSREKKKAQQAKPPFYRNKLVIGSVCVLVASLIAFVLVPVMSYVTTTEMTTVVRTSAAISKGMKIEAAMLQAVRVPALNVSGDALRTAEPAVGKYAAVDMVTGDLLMSSKLSDVMPFPDDYLYSIPEGKQAISTQIPSFAGGLSGKLQAGDIVSIYAVPNQSSAEDDDYRAILPPELSYVRVLAATNKLSVDKKEVSAADAEKGTEEEEQPVSVTLLVNPEQAAVIAGLNVNAKIHISLVSRGDEQAAQGYLRAQDTYFEEEPEEELIIVEPAEPSPPQEPESDPKKEEP